MSNSPDFIVSTDNELLMQFVRHRDEEAFRQLVERHAAMTMSVCRQVTRNEQDAEDAFQASWLILARRAGRLMHVTSLGGWLHRVAFRTALRAERKRAKLREGHLIEEAVIEPEEALRHIHAREIQRVLHEELRRIHPRYRNVIVLCDLQGKTRLEAAEQLGCTEASVKAALSRGRRRLRYRLLERGVLLSLAIITTNKAIATTDVSPDLLSSTVDLALRPPKTGTPSDASESVHTLVKEGLQVMTYSTLKNPIAISIALVLVAVPLVLLGRTFADRPTNTRVVVSTPADETAATQPIITSQSTDASSRSDSTDAEESTETDGDDNKIDSLTNELLATLRALLKSSEEGFLNGTGPSLDSVIGVRRKLSTLELELARMQSQRVEILKDELELFTRLEGRIAELDRGKMGLWFLQVKAERLETEIALTKAQTLLKAHDHKLPSE